MKGVKMSRAQIKRQIEQEILRWKEKATEPTELELVLKHFSAASYMQ